MTDSRKTIDPSTERIHSEFSSAPTLETLRARSPKPKSRTLAQAVRAHCLECSGGSYKAAMECPSALCELHDYREGKNPFRHPRSEKQQIAALKNLSPKASGSKTTSDVIAGE
jgi:hypothetical protein